MLTTFVRLRRNLLSYLRYPQSNVTASGAKYNTDSGNRGTLVREKMSMERGALIVFEGCDHSGKTTQCDKLVSALNSSGISSELMKFPDRTTIVGQMINDYLSNKQDLEDHTVHLLFSANRWERQPRMMELLRAGTTLIVDRYAYSGVAFTAAKEGFNMDWCKVPDAGLPQPDAVIYLDLSAEAAAKRGTFGGERYERTDFQKMVAANFQKLKDPLWKIIDAEKPIEDLHQELFKIVKDVIQESKNSPIKKLWIN